MSRGVRYYLVPNIGCTKCSDHDGQDRAQVPGCAKVKLGLFGKQVMPAEKQRTFRRSVPFSYCRVCLPLSSGAWQGLRGFLPGSHMCGGLPTEEAVGKVMKFKFLEVSSIATRARITMTLHTYVEILTIPATAVASLFWVVHDN